MNIILEGPDNAGKTTLALALSKETGIPLKEKEGKPSTWPDMLQKLQDYEKLDHMIIDRHPIISQSVYGMTVRDDPPIPESFLERFFQRDDLIIYCRCIADELTDHEASPTDTPEHLVAIEERYQEVLNCYDNWAAICANIIYTQYSQTDRIIAMVRAVLHECG